MKSIKIGKPYIESKNGKSKLIFNMKLIANLKNIL